MSPSDNGPHRFAFLLVPGFSLLSYAATIEPLRGANVLSGRTLYAWEHISPDGTPVRASIGVAVQADRRAGALCDARTILVCAGGNPALFQDETTFAWLRAEARRGAQIGGISGGPYMLARAGLLAGHRCTIHWEHRPAFQEEFPDLQVRQTLFERDATRMTCAGGMAALDMMCAVIESDHGAALANAVRDWFMQAEARAAEAPQRRPLGQRYGTSQPRVLAALERMEGNIETPLGRERLARLAGVSVRQLERLFAEQLGRTIGAVYLQLRLERGNRLLRESSMPVTQIAVACGFASASHFSRSFAGAYGRPPMALRRGAPRSSD